MLRMLSGYALIGAPFASVLHIVENNEYWLSTPHRGFNDDNAYSVFDHFIED